MRTLILALLLAVLSPASAAQTSKDAKIAHLMRITGMNEMLAQQREFGQKQAAAIGPQLMTEVKKQLAGMDDQAEGEFNSAFERFVANAKPSWTVEEAVSAYGRFYGEQLDEEDLDKIIAYYESPIGQKDIAASQSGVPKWIAFLAAKNEAVIKQAMDTYLADLKSAVERAKNRKK